MHFGSTCQKNAIGESFKMGYIISLMTKYAMRLIFVLFIGIRHIANHYFDELS